MMMAVKTVVAIAPVPEHGHIPFQLKVHTIPLPTFHTGSEAAIIGSISRYKQSHPLREERGVVSTRLSGTLITRDWECRDINVIELKEGRQIIYFILF